MKKIITFILSIAIITGFVTDSSSFSVYATNYYWKSNSTGWWVEDSSGWNPTNQWLKIDGKWYYFDADGYMDHDGYRDGYWLDSDGSLFEDRWGGHWQYSVYGWKYPDSAGWFYEGGLSTYPSLQWLKIDGKWYHFNELGYMEKNQYINGCWLKEDGSWDTSHSDGHWSCDNKGWWYTDSSGWYPTGEWLWIDYHRFYFKKNGYVAMNEWVDGSYFDSNGYWIPGKSNSNGKNKEYYGKYDSTDPVEKHALKISKLGENDYRVNFSKYRLTTITNAVGTVTEKGLEFYATDSSGKKVKGIITVNDTYAAVEITYSTWDYLKKGDFYSFTKISNNY